MKHLNRLLLLLLTVSTFTTVAQTQLSAFETYPVFSNCENQSGEELRVCFTNSLQDFVYSNFKIPDIVNSNNYTGEVSVLFEVTKEGVFEVYYIDAAYQELKDEVNRVFAALPTVQPAMFNTKPTYVQFSLPIAIPLVAPQSITTDQQITSIQIIDNLDAQEDRTGEYDEIKNLGYTNQEFRSQLNVPLSHQLYARLDPSLNKVGLNNHTAQKPYVYDQTNKYYDFETNYAPMLKDKTSWWGRKLWNEHLVTFAGDNYWLSLDPGVDLQVGKGDGVDTYNNTRMLFFQGGLGKNLNFYAAVYESQGRFAGYFNRYAESLAPDGGNPAIIPGRGIAEAFKEDSYDYPVAEGYVSFAPSKYFNIQLGHGRNFIGDGYRSLLLSDNASPYPYFKLNTSFWKLKYTNTWMSLRDVRSEVTEDGSFRTKYMANHYLSLNVTKRLNIGLFESVIWENDNNRGFDFNYLNPVIFYRAIEFSTGSRGGNALIGLTGKYKFSDRVNMYSQLIIDEFSSSDIFGGDQSWKNKLGFQVGAKYYDAFGVKNLYLQAEYNQVRPYTYSHNTVTLNYGQNNQSLAHLWGANFKEAIAIARYEHNRIYGFVKIIFGKKGFDFNQEGDLFAYGGDIYREEADRPYELGHEIGQGNTTDIFIGELQAGYIINPLTNLKIYGSIIFRDFTPEVDTATEFKSNSTWVNFGIRTDVFNWYYDF